MGMVLSVVVGRELGDDGAGIFFSTVAAFTIASNVLELGADTGLVRMLSRYVALGRLADIRRTVVIAITPVVAVGAAALVGLWFLAPTIFSGSKDAESVIPLFRAILPLTLAASLLLVVLGGTRGLGSVTPFTLIWNVAVPMSRPILIGLVIIVGGYGIEAAMTAWAWPLAPALLIAAVILRRQMARTLTGGSSGGSGSRDGARSAPPTATGTLWREFWGFSAARGVAAALEIMQSWVDVLLVAALRSPAEAGVYAIVSRSATSGLLVESAARVAVGPRISALLAHDDIDGASALQRRATSAMVLVAWPFYIVLAVFGPVVLSVFGEDFASGATALIVLCGAMMVLIAGGMVHSVLLLGGRSHWQMGNRAVGLVVLVSGNLILTPRFGIVGAASVWAATILIDTMLATVEVNRGLGVPIRWRAQLLPAALALLVFGGLGLAFRARFGADASALAGYVVVAGGVYALVCWRLRPHLGLEIASLTRR